MDTRSSHQAEFLLFYFFHGRLDALLTSAVGHCQIYHPASVRYPVEWVRSRKQKIKHAACTVRTHTTQYSMGILLYLCVIVIRGVELLKKNNHKPNHTAYFMELLKDTKYVFMYETVFCLFLWMAQHSSKNRQCVMLVWVTRSFFLEWQVQVCCV